MAAGRPEAIILDLDDTILDSGDPEVSWRQVCTEFAGNFSVAPGCFFAALIDARDWFWDDHLLAREGRLDLLSARRTIFARALRSLGLEHPKPDVLGAMALRYTALRDEAVTPFQGALTALERLRERGIKLALPTNGSAEKQWGKIRQFGLVRYFDHIQVEGDVGFGKPDAQAFQFALSGVDARPQETWMVGDNLLADIAGAQRAGIHAIWIDAHGNGLDSGDGVLPDRIVESLEELL